MPEQTADPHSFDDGMIANFAETLEARGMDLAPEQILAFVEKKARGETEAQIIQRADEGTRRVKSAILAKGALQGTAFGAVIAPLADWVKEGRPSWREILNRAPKTAAVGVALGACTGLILAERHIQATAEDLENRWTDFKNTTHEMESAWVDTIEARASQNTTKDRGLA